MQQQTPWYRVKSNSLDKSDVSSWMSRELCGDTKHVGDIDTLRVEFDQGTTWWIEYDGNSDDEDDDRATHIWVSVDASKPQVDSHLRNIHVTTRSVSYDAPRDGIMQLLRNRANIPDTAGCNVIVNLSQDFRPRASLYWLRIHTLKLGEGFQLIKVIADTSDSYAVTLYVRMATVVAPLRPVTESIIVHELSGKCLQAIVYPVRLSRTFSSGSAAGSLPPLEVFRLTSSPFASLLPYSVFPIQIEPIGQIHWSGTTNHMKMVGGILNNTMFPERSFPYVSVADYKAFVST